MAIKGILHREDAKIAVEHGIDAVIVSNHGGTATGRCAISHCRIAGDCGGGRRQSRSADGWGDSPGQPLIEIALFIVIGQAIGLWLTLLGVIVIAIIGTAIIRWQGLSLLAEIRTNFRQGQLPARALADAMLVAIAGVLMVVPGYFTDSRWYCVNDGW